MKHKILAVLAAGGLLVGSFGSTAFAQSAASTTATKADKEQMDKSGKTNDSCTKAPVDGSKSDKVGDATAPKSAGTDNPKTGVAPSKSGAADQTQAPK